MSQLGYRLIYLHIYTIVSIGGQSNFTCTRPWAGCLFSKRTDNFKLVDLENWKNAIQNTSTSYCSVGRLDVPACWANVGHSRCLCSHESRYLWFLRHPGTVRTVTAGPTGASSSSAANVILKSPCSSQRASISDWNQCPMRRADRGHPPRNKLRVTALQHPGSKHNTSQAKNIDVRHLHVSSFTLSLILRPRFSTLAKRQLLLTINRLRIASGLRRPIQATTDG